MKKEYFYPAVLIVDNFHDEEILADSGMSGNTNPYLDNDENPWW